MADFAEAPEAEAEEDTAAAGGEDESEYEKSSDEGADEAPPVCDRVVRRGRARHGEPGDARRHWRIAWRLRACRGG